MSSEDDPIDFLIVDDERLIHALVIRMLRADGFKNFYPAYDANEALRVMRSRKVDFVITDWLMPVMTGIELIRVVRGDPKLFATPAIVLTGVCSAESVVYAMEEGADGYIVKPFTADKLVKTIKSIRGVRSDPLQLKILELISLKINGNYSEAVELARGILDIKWNSKVLFILGECLAKMKQYPAALNILEESGCDKSNGKCNNLLGKIYMEQGEKEKGIEFLKLASEQCPLNMSRKIDLAEAYFKLERTGEAETVVDAVLKSNPTNLILADVGNLYIEQGDTEKAGALLKEGILPTPETVPTFNKYAIALRRDGRYDESKAIYKKCIDLVPDSFALYFNAGMLYGKMKDYPQAQTMFELALRLNPEYEPAKVFLETVKSKIQH